MNSDQTYRELSAKAKDLMRKGRVKAYLETLLQLQEVRQQITLLSRSAS